MAEKYERKFETLPKDFGKGWMTANARDLAKIAVALAGFDAKTLAMRLAKTKTRGALINAATVERGGFE